MDQASWTWIMNDEKKIKDRGGTRSGTDRRKKKKASFDPNKRSKKNRRSGKDRREGLGIKRVEKNGGPIERRDVFRDDV